MIFEMTTSGYSLGLMDEGKVIIRPRLTVRRIQDVVAAYYDIPPSEMTSARRGWGSSRPRQVAMYLSRQLTPKSFPDLGRLFHRDHTTVIHATHAIPRRMKADPDLANDVRTIRERLVA